MHRGHTLAAAVWIMTVLSLGLVALRLYTRIRIVNFVGIEDYLYALTGFFLLIFACCIQVAVHYGLGRSLWGLELPDTSHAIMWTYIANSFVISGNAIAKLCMGFFLLRVVPHKRQKAAIWFLIVVTVATSTTLIVMLWNQTTPRRTAWDPLRTPGVFNISIQPMNVGLGAWSSACDFFYAIFPWLFIMSLRMPRREKIILASSMSLGVIAGACGIARTIVLSRLGIEDFTLNFAPYFIWAGAEIVVAMFCLGIPTFRPLYLKRRGISTTDYGKRHDSQHSDPELPRFTMIDRKSQRTSTPYHYGQVDENHVEHTDKTPYGSPADSSNHQYLRDSGSSHTMVEGSPPTSTPLRPPPTPRSSQLPPHTITKPAKAHLERDGSDSDSVDVILGLYDGRRSQSRSRSRNKKHHNREGTATTKGGNGSDHLITGGWPFMGGIRS
ncbi:hypothetical protein QBC43DRAFT_320440 [Cladorrhinum sp. PSN259]|nr:hypothetical protein QBC43DRAFT_320440 [Cladorrhinum sp. PSN259]